MPNGSIDTHTDSIKQEPCVGWREVGRLKNFDRSLGPVRIRGGRFYVASNVVDVVIEKDFLGEVTATFSPQCEHILLGFKDDGGTEYIPREYRLLSEPSQ